MKIIVAENISKKYMLTHNREAAYTTLRDAIANQWANFCNKITPLTTSGIRIAETNTEEFWALGNVSFEINQGDSVGIIGRNGAGKSTLLKILSRITEPTSGKVTIRGRVASLLEVGTGFHPELTGRENIFLNGAILGMNRAEIQKKFDEIVAFAEVERFLDTPVKRYSSGMYVRLAFAVAAHLEPEILIVDEVLAVGDAQFQKKCLGKMGDVSDKEGRTVIFVSHNMAAIRALCKKAFLLQAGELAFAGEVEEGVSQYLSAEDQKFSFEQVWDDIETAPGNEIVRLRRICLVPQDTTSNDQISIRTPFNIELEYWCLKKDICLSLSMHIVTQEEVIAFATTTWQEPEWHGKPFKRGLYRSACRIPGDFLNIGPYKIRIFFVENGTQVICRMDDVLLFELGDSLHDRCDWHGKWDGVVRPNLKWCTEFVTT